MGQLSLGRDHIGKQPLKSEHHWGVNSIWKISLWSKLYWEEISPEQTTRGSNISGTNMIGRQAFTKR